MVELSQLYEEVARLVEQQETPVQNIEQDASNTKTNVQDANKNINSAIVSARKARKWKWIILLIFSMYLYSLIMLMCTDADLDYSCYCWCCSWCWCWCYPGWQSPLILTQNIVSLSISAFLRSCYNVFGIPILFAFLFTLCKLIVWLIRSINRSFCLFSFCDYYNYLCVLYTNLLFLWVV